MFDVGAGAFVIYRNDGFSIAKARCNLSDAFTCGMQGGCNLAYDEEIHRE